VFEELENIRDRISDASKFQQWAFTELKRHVEYKAKAEGNSVETVHPGYTSQRCSETGCGFTHEDNRDGDVFVCQNVAKSYTATTTRRETSHTSISRTGSSLGLEGHPITVP
jgi:putative transposase